MWVLIAKYLEETQESQVAEQQQIIAQQESSEGNDPIS
jgi:hypothetical protein